MRPVGRPRGTGAGRVYAALRARILSLDLRPGAELEGYQTAEEFGVSRTLVREAFVRLEAEGLVQLLPNRSARVSYLELSEIADLLEILELFGCITTRWAAFRHDEKALHKMKLHRRGWREAAVDRDYARMSEENNRFHEAIAGATGNDYLVNMYRSLLSRYHRLSYTLYSGMPNDEEEYRRYYERVDREHTEMLNAVEASDVEKADAMARRHARQMNEQINYYLSRNLADVFPGQDPANPANG